MYGHTHMASPRPSPGEPDIEAACDGCGRGLPTYLRDRESTMAVRLDGLGDEHDATERVFCGDCAEEVTELTAAMTAAGEAGMPTSNADLRAAEACGLCDRGVDAAASGLTVRWRGSRHGSGDRYALCADCGSVLREFLANVPESVPAGEVWCGDAPDVGVPAAEADRTALAATFDGVRAGDELRVESHREPSASAPPAYTELAGEVVRRDEMTGIVDCVVAGDDEVYHLTRPAPTVDRLTLRRETESGVAHLGDVTVLDVVAEAPRPEPTGDADGYELDHDSALVPEFVDLESSAD